MKHVCILVLLAASCLGQMPEVSVDFAHTNYPVIFADSSLSVTNRQRIASDLAKALSLAGSLDDLKGGSLGGGRFSLADRTMLFWKERRGVALLNQNSGWSFELSKTVSDRYQTAFLWEDAHTNAMQKLTVFISTINSSNLLELGEAALKGLCHANPLSAIGGDDPPTSTEIQEVFETQIAPYHCPGASILNLYIREVPQVGDVEIPIITLFMVNRQHPQEIYALPIGFYEGKWGLGNFPDPD